MPFFDPITSYTTRPWNPPYFTRLTELCSLKSRKLTLVEAGTLIPLYETCRTKDVNVYPRFKRFREYARSLGAEIEFKEVEGYQHDWAFGDLAIKDALNFFQNAKEDEAGE